MGELIIEVATRYGSSFTICDKKGKCEFCFAVISITVQDSATKICSVKAKNIISKTLSSHSVFCCEILSLVSSSTYVQAITNHHTRRTCYAMLSASRKRTFLENSARNGRIKLRELGVNVVHSASRGKNGRRDLATRSLDLLGERDGSLLPVVSAVAGWRWMQ